MSDNEGTTQNPGSPGGDGTPRESETGRYVSRQQPGAAGEANKEEEKEGKKRWLLLLILLLILLLLLCAGFAYWRWWSGDDPKDPTGTPTPIVTTQTAQPTPTATAPTSPSPSPSPSVRTVAMPNVVGMKASEAKITLEAAGLTNLKFVEQGKTESLTLLVSFTVTAQSVPAGTQIPVDTAITLTCTASSNGKG